MHAAAWQTDSVRCRWQKPTCKERCTGRGTTWRRGWQPLTDIRSDAGRLYSLHARHYAECACHSAVAPVQPEVLYSGADDCAFKGWDLRQQPVNPTFCNRRDQVGLRGASCAQRGPAAGLSSVDKALPCLQACWCVLHHALKAQATQGLLVIAGVLTRLVSAASPPPSTVSTWW